MTIRRKNQKAIKLLDKWDFEGKIRRKCQRCQIRKDLISLLESLLKDDRIHLGRDIRAGYKERLAKLKGKNA